jgi:hypothetical protein
MVRPAVVKITARMRGDVITGLRDKLCNSEHLSAVGADLSAVLSPEFSHLWAIDFTRWEHLARQIDHIHKELYGAASHWLPNKLLRYSENVSYFGRSA